MQIKKNYTFRDAIKIAELGDQAFKFSDRKEDPRIGKMHWLGGNAITPACGDWGWAPGIRTDYIMSPEKIKEKGKIDCQICMLLLGLKKNIKDLHFYASIYPNEYEKIRGMGYPEVIASKERKKKCQAIK